MDNHFHLLVEGERDAVSEAMRRIKGRHSRFFNDRYDRTGPLFEGRFDARLVEAEEYVYQAIAYIRGNPVKAGLCERADDWPWAGP